MHIDTQTHSHIDWLNVTLNNYFTAKYHNAHSAITIYSHEIDIRKYSIKNSHV